MFTFRRPTEEKVREYLMSLKDAPQSYAPVGCTRDERQGEPIPKGFNRDHERVLLGKGEEVLRRACHAIQTWQMMPPSVVQPCPAGVPIEEGAMVCNLFRAWTLGGWLVLPTRILYLVDETTGDFTRSGFAYGTVQGHWEHGEERFLVEWDRRDDSVWYDLLVFSRPRHPLARLAYPYSRYEQGRFRRLSCEAMGALGGKVKR
jgi:uncharacterized protein (UPF0548 family)